MSTGRLEAFSDGVIAVAATLLILNIAVPKPGAHTSLAHALLSQWPAYAAYATSFITIGIIWINHHVMIGRLRRPDHTILIVNLVLLLTIGVLPFGTSLMATYLKESHGQNLAAGVYAGLFLLMSLAFATLNHRILFADEEALSVKLAIEERRLIFRRTVTGIVPYVLAVALAAVSPYVTLAICGTIAVFYALPIAQGARGAR